MNKRIHLLHVSALLPERKLVRHALEKEHGGFQVIEADSRREFEACLEEGSYDLVLCDSHVPGFEGLTLIEAIKTKNLSLPVIVIVESGSEEIGIKALELGAADYVLKTPQYLRRLPYTIRAVLEKKHLQRERDRAEVILREYAERLEVRSKIDHVVDAEETISWETGVNAALDIERKRAEKGLRQLSMAVEQSATQLVITDLDGNIVFVNQAFEKTTGYTKAEVIGQNPRTLKTDYLPPEAYENLWQTITTGGSWSGEFLNKRKDGSTYWENAVITPITNDQGEIINYIAVKEDITQRKMAEAELKKAKEAAEAASRLKSEFLANMSHEIRTPMNAILGFTELLSGEETDPGKREKLEIIKRSGKHLLNLLNDILDFSKIEAGKIEIEPKRFALKKLFADIYSQFSVKAAEQHLTLSVNIDDVLPQIVYGDTHRINQIMLNLLSNAFKFTKNGNITLNCTYQQGIVTIQIADTGIGIPAEKHYLIFSPFEQIDASTARHHGGAGLGLAITKRLVELMGGRIFFESQVGVGSTFTIELPLPGMTEEVFRDELATSDESREYAQAINGEKMVQTWLQGMRGNPVLEGILLESLKYLPEKIRILEDAIYWNIPADIKFISHSLKGVSGNLGLAEIYAKILEIDQEMRNEVYNLERVNVIFAQLQKIVASIPPSYFGNVPRELKGVADMASQFTILVAEDNEVNQMLIQELLEGMSLRCDLAGNGEIALEKLKKQKYDLVLLDMQMPVLDGVETIKRIRSDETLNDLHVIALTAHAIKGDAEKYLDLGCDDYLPKPIRIEQFRECIHQVLLKNVIRHAQEALTDRTETADFESSNVLLTVEQRKALQEIIHGLQENCEIFNPSQIVALAEKLTEFSSIKDLQAIKRKLAAVADTFDDQALKPIVKSLEEFCGDCNA